MPCENNIDVVIDCLTIFISMSRIDPMADVDDGGLPPRSFWDVRDAIEKLKEPAKDAMAALIARMDEGFWDMSRREQVLQLLLNKDEFHVSQRNISRVMNVVDSRVSTIKRYYEDHPDEVFRMRGRPSIITPVFGQVVSFINDEMKDGRAVTLGVLKEYMADKLHVHVRRKVLWQYMKNNGYTFVSGVPTESTRVEVKVDDLLSFYNTTLPEAIE